MIINRVYEYQNLLSPQLVSFMVGLRTYQHPCMYRGVDKSLARPTSRYILFDGENISFDASLVIYIYIYIYIQGVPGGKDLTSGECSLCQTIPI